MRTPEYFAHQNVRSFFGSCGTGEVNCVQPVSPVAADLDQPIIRSDRQLAKAQRAFVQAGDDGSERHVAADAAAGQVAAEGFPIGSLVKRPVHPVRCHVQDVILVSAQPDGRLPIPAQWRFAEGVLGMDAHVGIGIEVLAAVIAKL